MEIAERAAANGNRSCDEQGNCDNGLALEKVRAKHDPASCNPSAKEFLEQLPVFSHVAQIVCKSCYFKLLRAHFGLYCVRMANKPFTQSRDTHLAGRAGFHKFPPTLPEAARIPRGMTHS